MCVCVDITDSRTGIDVSGTRKKMLQRRQPAFRPICVRGTTNRAPQPGQGNSMESSRKAMPGVASSNVPRRYVRREFKGASGIGKTAPPEAKWFNASCGQAPSRKLGSPGTAVPLYPDRTVRQNA
jgi:hypothetical protein